MSGPDRPGTRVLGAEQHRAEAGRRRTEGALHEAAEFDSPDGEGVGDPVLVGEPGAGFDFAADLVHEAERFGLAAGVSAAVG